MRRLCHDARTLGTFLAGAPRSRQLLFALLVLGCAFLVLALAYFSPVSYAGSDPQPSLLLSQAILEHGTIKLDAYMGLEGVELGKWTVQNENGHFYYYWPIGPSLLSLPFVWALNQLGMDMSNLAQNNWAQNLLSALICALVFLIVYRLGRHYLQGGPSLAIALISTLGSALISTMGTALWNINFAVLFTALALLQLVRTDHQAGTAVNPYWLGALLFLAYLCRPSTSIFVLLVLGFLLLKGRNLFIKTAATSLALLAGYLGLSWLEYGQPLPQYFDPARLSAHSFPFWVALYGHLLSPSRGILVFSPFLALIIGGAVWYFRHVRGNALFWLAVAWIGLLVLLASRATNWWGGHSFGPRILTEVIPALIVVTILLWRRVSPEIEGHTRAAILTSYVSLGLLAIGINSYQGLFNVNTQRWNGFGISPNVSEHPTYLFDWQYPQFLASNKALCTRNLAHMQGGMEQGSFSLRTYWPGTQITYDFGFDDLPPPAGMVTEEGVGLPEQNRANLHWIFLPLAADTRADVIFIGWSTARNNFRWSECRSASIYFKPGEELIAPGKPYWMEITAGSSGAQSVLVFLNGSRLGEVTFPGPHTAPVVRLIKFDGALIRRNTLNEIRFYLPDASAPSKSEPRRLGLAFSKLRIYPTD
jgi:hypothetical protein